MRPSAKATDNGAGAALVVSLRRRTCFGEMKLLLAPESSRNSMRAVPRSPIRPRNLAIVWRSGEVDEEEHVVAGEVEHDEVVALSM